uniref:hypothetical protein n=1 Tax=Ectobacillus funiculus TaxID=137993 RepID=UPI003977FD50
MLSADLQWLASGFVERTATNTTSIFPSILVHVRIEIILYSYLDFERHRSYAYDKKGQLHQRVNYAQNEVEAIHKLFELVA